MDMTWYQFSFAVSVYHRILRVSRSLALAGVQVGDSQDRSAFLFESRSGILSVTADQFYETPVILGVQVFHHVLHE
jgi:hypothetical protein